MNKEPELRLKKCKVKLKKSKLKNKNRKKQNKFKKLLSGQRNNMLLKNNFVQHFSLQQSSNRILKAAKRRACNKTGFAIKKAKSEKINMPNTPIIIESDDSNDSDCICIDPSTPKIELDLNVSSEIPPLIDQDQNNEENVEQEKNVMETSILNQNSICSWTPIFPKSELPLNEFIPIVNEETDKTMWKPPILPRSKFSVMGSPHQNCRTKMAKTVESNAASVIVIDDTLKTDMINENNTSVEKIKTSVAEETVINLDETVITLDKTVDTTEELAQNTETTTIKDLIIKIDDSMSQLPEFIPLNKNEITTGKQKKFKSMNTIKQKNLFTVSEMNQLDKYNDNTYNPNDGVLELKPKRMVIIDGSNVAFHHGLNQCFSVKGIKISVDYFESRGHEVKVVIPMFRLHKCTDPILMEQLRVSGKTVMTPCKKVHGVTTISYDDRFILQLATQLDAAIVSNDNYRDLVMENKAFEKIIKNRVIGYSWCNDIFLLPKDPYGKWGPTLDSILNRV